MLLLILSIASICNFDSLHLYSLRAPGNLWFGPKGDNPDKSKFDDRAFRVFGNIKYMNLQAAHLKMEHFLATPENDRNEAQAKDAMRTWLREAYENPIARDVQGIKVMTQA